MTRLATFAAACLLSTAVHAAVDSGGGSSDETTVTLTQSELTTLIQGAVAERQASPMMRAAAPVWDKVRKAFAPPQAVEPQKP